MGYINYSSRSIHLILAIRILFIISVNTISSLKPDEDTTRERFVCSMSCSSLNIFTGGVGWFIVFTVNDAFHDVMNL